MKKRRNRLAELPDRVFSGDQLDRSQIVRFTLDGRKYQGFLGDSILSAVLASGVDSFGEIEGELIALDERLCPAVIDSVARHDLTQCLPMDRATVVDGMNLVTIRADGQFGENHQSLMDKTVSLWRRITGKFNRSLDLDAATLSALPGPWIVQKVQQELHTDLIVVGAGLAGMSAALEGAARGLETVLIERQTVLGGDALFFGGGDGHARPLDLIKELEEKLSAHPKVKIMRRCKAFSAVVGAVNVHQVFNSDAGPTTQTTRISSSKIVLATGAMERLPVFPGNRLPGVIGARAAFNLASRYGIWAGSKTAYTTSSSAATQVALLAADLEVEIEVLADSRRDPRSRFFEFAKAYGATLARGLKPAKAELDEDGRLNFTLELSVDEPVDEQKMMVVDRLVVCGGWQRDLSLWHMAGGKTRWAADQKELVATGEVANLKLAGYCDGAMNISNCMQSGDDAVRALVGDETPTETARDVVPNVESDDGELTLTLPKIEEPRCYLDSGLSLSVLPAARKEKLLHKLFGFGQSGNGMTVEAPKPLSLNDVVAKVLLGEISADFAGIVAQERCVVASVLLAGGDGGLESEDATFLWNSQFPLPYLVGRFGDREGTRSVTSDAEHPLETGCSVFLDMNEKDPRNAIGVIVGQNKTGAHSGFAYLDLDRAYDQANLFVRSGAQVFPVSLTDVAGA